MAETTTRITRGDADIQDAVEALILRYPPASNDRHEISVQVTDGTVTLKGYTKSVITRRYLLETIPTVEGVRAVNADRFFDDETIRIEAGRMIPFGVLANVEYGAVILTGSQPDGTTTEALASAIGNLSGVRRVVVALR